MTARNDISSRTCEIAHAVEAAQLAMFTAAKRDHGLSLTVLAAETGIPLGTLRMYAPAKDEAPVSIMPITAFVKLAKVVPNHLLSLMLEGAGKEISDACEDESDYDDLARAALDYAAEHAGARHPESDGGIRLVHTETPRLKMKARALKAAAKKVAA